MYRERIRSHYNKIKDLYLKYERVLMPAALVIGFVVDYLTFTNIEISTTLTVLSSYWLVAALTIIFINLYDSDRLSPRLRYVRLFAPLLIQFIFGGLLGGSFIFYWFSGSLWVSWPIIILFVALMLSNDAFRHYLQNPIVQMGAYGFITLSLFSVALPFLVNSLSPWLFVLAGVITVGATWLLIYFISRIRQFGRREKLHLFTPVAAVLVVMNIFYFADIIPPIPLSLREAGPYHSVQRGILAGYRLLAEKQNLFQKITPGQTLHLVEGERAYVYTAIFAPAELNAPIIHHWQYYDKAKGDWVSMGKPSFTLTGGRKEGFRGYSYKTGIKPGKWRVDVETSRGQVLGRVRFKVERAEGQVPLVEVLR